MISLYGEPPDPRRGRWDPPDRDSGNINPLRNQFQNGYPRFNPPDINYNDRREDIRGHVNLENRRVFKKNYPNRVISQ